MHQSLEKFPIILNFSSKANALKKKKCRSLSMWAFLSNSHLSNLFLITGSSRLAQGTLEPCLTSILISVVSSPPVLARMEFLAASSSQWQIPCSLAERANKCSSRVTVFWCASLDVRQLESTAEQNVSQTGTPCSWQGGERSHSRNEGNNQVVGDQSRRNTARCYVSSPVLGCTLWLGKKWPD